MLANQTTKPKGFGTWLWQVVSASPQADGTITVALQILLASLWCPLVASVANALSIVSDHPVLVSRLLTGYLNNVMEEADGWEYTVVLVGLTLLCGWAAALFAYIPFRIVARNAASKATFFVRCWWRACLWETVWLIPFGVLYGFFAKETQFRSLLFSLSPLAGLVFLIFAPTFLARIELRAARLRLSKWRPACPECGYSLQRLTLPRCPECGIALPTAGRTFRRWAHRRLLWDRTQRGSALIAYPFALLAILVCPCHAGRAVALPDRYGRALRWAMFHIMLTAAIACLHEYSYAIRSYIYTELGFTGGQPAGNLIPYSPYLEGSLARGIQCWLAWIVTLAAIPLVGCGLAYAGFNQHPAARRTMLKWSLYACAAIPITYLITRGMGYFPCFHDLAAQRQLMSSSIVNVVPPPLAPLTRFVTVYALYWAVGIANNAYLPRRGIGVFLKYLALYAGAWLLLTYLLYPLGPLKCLL